MEPCWNWFRNLKQLGRKYSWIIQLSETFQQIMVQEGQCIWYNLSQGGGDAAWFQPYTLWLRGGDIVSTVHGSLRVVCRKDKWEVCILTGMHISPGEGIFKEGGKAVANAKLCNPYGLHWLEWWDGEQLQYEQENLELDEPFFYLSHLTILNPYIVYKSYGGIWPIWNLWSSWVEISLSFGCREYWNECCAEVLISSSEIQMSWLEVKHFLHQLARGKEWNQEKSVLLLWSVSRALLRAVALRNPTVSELTVLNLTVLCM
jgi:hypothetical protein